MDNLKEWAVVDKLDLPWEVKNDDGTYSDAIFSNMESARITQRSIKEEWPTEKSSIKRVCIRVQK